MAREVTVAGSQRSRSGVGSGFLLGLAGVLFALAGLAAWLNTTLVNADHFARYANDVRRDPAVARQFGILVGSAAVDAEPDLIAIRPALEGAAAAVLGSSALDTSFEAAIRSAHSALATEGSDSAVVTLADLGATITVGLQKFFPEVASRLPPGLAESLARVGGQEGLAARIIPVVELTNTLAWVLPALAVVSVLFALWLAPSRRIALVRLGWLVGGGGLALGLLSLAMAIAAAAISTNSVGGAIGAAALRVLSGPLLVRAVATTLVGGLLVAGAGGSLPRLELFEELGKARALLRRRPSRPSLEVARALAIALVGTLIVLFPEAALHLLAALAGVAILFFGVAELDRVADRYVAAERAAAASDAAGQARPSPRLAPRARWLLPGASMVGIVVILVVMLLPGALPQASVPQPVADPNACNGHVQLCDRRYSDVAFPATHNSMAAADEDGWYLAEQPTGMVKSLDDGVRVFLVDTWYGQATAAGSVVTAPVSFAAAQAALTKEFGSEVVGSLQRTIDRVRREPGVGPVEPYFCHTVCEIGATKVLPVLNGVRAWMDRHPREVVTFFIQDTVTPADTAALFAQAGLADRAYEHNVGKPWPTLRQLIESRKTLVVLMENQSGGTKYPWLMAGFEQTQDTPFSFATVNDFNCNKNRGSGDAQVLLVNHWLASFAHLVTNAEKANAEAVLWPRVEQCRAQRRLMPTYVAVNWYNLGDLFAVVDRLNGL